jgi:hypothetical protein
MFLRTASHILITTSDDVIEIVVVFGDNHFKRIIIGGLTLFESFLEIAQVRNCYSNFAGFILDRRVSVFE